MTTGTLLKQELSRCLAKYGYILQEIKETEEETLVIGEKLIGSVEGCSFRKLEILAVHSGVYRREKK